MLAPEPTPEMQRVPLDEALLSVCDLGLDDCTDIPEEDVEAYGPCCYVMNFLKQAPDPPLPKDVWNAFKELQHVGALDRAGFLTHLGALLVRLPMSPGLGSAFYFASLLGVPEAASQVAASLDGREPFSRQKNEDASSAMNFAEGADKKKRWSDVFAMAKALGEFESQSSRDAPRFCRDKGLIYPVMQQLSSAMQQLKRVSWDLSKACLHWTPSVAFADGTADAWEGDTAAWEGDCASFPKDSLEDSWPIMQTMLTLAYSWNIGNLEGGRRVNAGWAKAARLHRTSVLVDDEPPPCALLTYVELTNSGGRILRGGTTVTPQQLLFCGGRGGAFWQNDTAVLEKWLEIEADFESAALLAALRTCNSLVLHKAAELSLQDFRGQWIDWTSRQSLLDLIEKWRRCVVQVAFLPLPEKISVWEMDFSRIIPTPAPASSSENQLAVAEQLALPPMVLPPMLAPVATFAAVEEAPHHTTRWQHRPRTSMPPQQWHAPPQEPQQPPWIPCGSTGSGAVPNMSPDTHRTSMPPQQWHAPPQEPQQPPWIPCGSAGSGAVPNMSPDTHRTSMPPQQWHAPPQEPQQPPWIPCGSTGSGAVQPDHYSNRPAQWHETPQPHTKVCRKNGPGGDTGSSWWD
ncbi:unnamed protein product [Cladocopium goreaui]|uniref:Helicase-associated domain-containing protein n=1 Tax=Cladocopium goreaui TaxID=2562237 RepID=A0A9P1CCZ7_9DINO|nr:unnamed protein product [Cladocopium goreaui]